jgi:hypothetical protein
MLPHLEKMPPRAIKRWWGIATAAALVLLIAAIQDRAYTAFVRRIARTASASGLVLRLLAIEGRIPHCT